MMATLSVLAGSARTHVTIVDSRYLVTEFVPVWVNNMTSCLHPRRPLATALDSIVDWRCPVCGRFGGQESFLHSCIPTCKQGLNVLIGKKRFQAHPDRSISPLGLREAYKERGRQLAREKRVVSADQKQMAVSLVPHTANGDVEDSSEHDNVRSRVNRYPP